MAKTSIKEYLMQHKTIHSGMIGSSILIDKLEVYGYINTCKDEDMYSETYLGYSMNGVINKDSKNQIILSNSIHQVTMNYRGKEIVPEVSIFAVYKSLSVSEAENSYNIEDLQVPSISGKQLYRKIKSRTGTGVVVYDYELKKAKFPSNIRAEEGKAILSAPEGHIQMFDKDGVMKSVGENIIVVCRYIHTETGTMCYTQYNLDEVFVDDTH